MSRAHAARRRSEAESYRPYRAGKPAIGLSEILITPRHSPVDAAGQRRRPISQAIDYNPDTSEIAGSEAAEARYLKPYFRKGWEI